ncbi:sigma-70 family RNA polymerase sigma factor [Actinokineospora auranticolor]|uniref:RNA polymerase sigma factor n=1 Tax=Actinokineospora auranticolor TaxID=155976 RepID=A0A2S6GUN1_9PSEU|nr:sigma-70 family RNA polymerase sigma factor [Actinokineospora auranticolor]PPK68903.1 RNA polymerase sigma factor (sigma-70 family) [Actinokineospora auranticolor]
MQPSDPSDTSLAARARAGDSEAFALLYDRYRESVARFLTRLTGDPHLAEDLTQEAFVSAMRNLRSLRRPGRFRPWLFTIAHRGALDHIRRGGPVLLPDLPELAAGDASPEDAADANEATRLVWDAAASLEPRQLAVLELTLRDEVTTAELAGALEVRTAHAAVLAHRARSALGHAVRLLLLARNPRHCERLANLVPARPQRLSRAQRASVDRHLRRCPNCRALASRLTAPTAVLSALLVAPSPRVDDPAWAAMDTSRHLVRKTAVTLTLTVLLTALVSVAPPDALPPEAEFPSPTPDLPAVSTSRPSTPTSTVDSTTSVAPQPPSSTRVSSASPTTTSRPAVQAEPVRLVTSLNARRTTSGCPPLRVDPRLTEAARSHSAAMMRADQVTLAPENAPTLQQRLADTGYHTAAGYFVAATQKTADELAPLLPETPYDCTTTSIGTAQTRGGPCGYYWTVIYAVD